MVLSRVRNRRLQQMRAENSEATRTTQQRKRFTIFGPFSVSAGTWVVGQSDFHSLPYCFRYVPYSNGIMQVPTKKKVIHQ
jgi:hypothetical protein